jgi:YebC/PmpR family DNA-binding regulatory protein
MSTVAQIEADRAGMALARKPEVTRWCALNAVPAPPAADAVRGRVLESAGFETPNEAAMAGHSKWANIQHRKKAQDAKRGKVFTKLIREITVSARTGDPDPAANPRLRLAVDKALAANMSKDTIERAIKRGSGAQEGENFDEIRYEGYGPGGVAVMVDCLTDNRNRTVSEVRHAFTKAGGNLGTSGSVAFQFSQTGILSYPAGSSEDAVMEAALEAGAKDVLSNDDGSIDVLTDPDDFVSVKEAMAAAGFEPENAEVTMRAENTTPLDRDDAEKMIRMLETLEDLDDVQNVYSNADIAEDILAEL